MEQKRNEIKVVQTNKKAYFNYEVLEDLEAGISLAGPEVKSIKGRALLIHRFICEDRWR